MIILNFEKEYMIHGINELNVQCAKTGRGDS